MGLYAQALRVWLQYARLSSLLIFRAEDFFRHPADVAKELFSFALPTRARAISWWRITAQHSNSKTQGHMLPATERMLRAFYAPYNAELERLLGRPMGWPTEGPAHAAISAALP